MQSGLFSAQELKPFIAYWIEVIAKNENSQEDGAWRAAFLTYINFYNYVGVLHLFELYGKSINPDSPLFQEILRTQPDRKLAQRLHAALHPPPKPNAGPPR